MFGTILFNGLTGFASVITYCYVLQSIKLQILGTTAVYPWIAVFKTATGSAAGAVGMTVPIIIVSFGMTINATAAASRQAWSFGRDKGLPFPSWFTKLTYISKAPIPLNATVRWPVYFLVVPSSSLTNHALDRIAVHLHCSCSSQSGWHRSL